MESEVWPFALALEELLDRGVSGRVDLPEVCRTIQVRTRNADLGHRSRAKPLGIFVDLGLG